jgi:hypothetical protein
MHGYNDNGFYYIPETLKIKTNEILLSESVKPFFEEITRKFGSKKPKEAEDNEISTEEFINNYLNMKSQSTIS